MKKKVVFFITNIILLMVLVPASPIWGNTSMKPTASLESQKIEKHQSEKKQLLYSSKADQDKESFRKTNEKSLKFDKESSISLAIAGILLLIILSFFTLVESDQSKTSRMYEETFYLKKFK